jgi:hypothetical protein
MLHGEKEKGHGVGPFRFRRIRQPMRIWVGDRTFAQAELADSRGHLRDVQMKSYAFDVVRSHIPTMDLDEAYADADTMAQFSMGLLGLRLAQCFSAGKLRGNRDRPQARDRPDSPAGAPDQNFLRSASHRRPQSEYCRSWTGPAARILGTSPDATDGAYCATRREGVCYWC